MGCSAGHWTSLHFIYDISEFLKVVSVELVELSLSPVNTVLLFLIFIPLCLVCF